MKAKQEIRLLKSREEMSLLEKAIKDLKEFWLEKAYYKVESKIEVTVKRKDEGFSYDVQYHKGNIPFPFEYSSKMAATFQEEGEKILSDRKDLNEVNLMQENAVYIFKPYMHIKNIINKLR